MSLATKARSFTRTCLRASSSDMAFIRQAIKAGYRSQSMTKWSKPALNPKNARYPSDNLNSSSEVASRRALLLGELTLQLRTVLPEANIGGDFMTLIISHIFPQWVSITSDRMLKINGNPIRGH